eukprot:TRINITY_DN5826_c0_g1_i3.p2 TRINITY_DN5826_c0_g1~~TRINITY_DN5826_c0_g1_i3.p2  ORF type:complete len:248 (+),score=114.81 TRINITY_DN5826_c0_g1_i3:65-808(+)
MCIRDRKKVHLKKILTLAKFMTIPDINRNTYREFCEKVVVREVEVDVSESSFDEEEDKPHLCVFVLQEHYEAVKPRLLDVQREVFHDAALRFKDSLYDNFDIVQFGTIDLKAHPKMDAIYRGLAEKTQNPSVNKGELPRMFALISPTYKLSFCGSKCNIENWIDDLIYAPETVEYEYISDQLNGESFGNYLRKENINVILEILALVWKDVMNWKIVLGIIAVFILNKFFIRLRTCLLYTSPSPRDQA